MSEPTPLRPIGTQFEHVEETSTQRITYLYRVVGHTTLHDLPSELIQLVAVQKQKLQNTLGGTERKTP